MNWSPNDWMNHGGSLLASDPNLAQRLIGKGITLEPEQAIGWFNLGIGLHQQRKISAAIKAYKHCLDLPHSTDTGIAARNNLSQDLFATGGLGGRLDPLQPTLQTKARQLPNFS